MGPYYFERCVSGCEANLEFTGLSFAELTLAHPNQSNTAFAWERCLKGIAFFRTHGSPAVPVAAGDSGRPGRVGPGRGRGLETFAHTGRSCARHLTTPL